MAAALIEYVCSNQKHHLLAPIEVELSESVSPVIVHEGRWAFCPRGSVPDHVWDQIDRTPVRRIRSRLAPATT
jgi:hypothetical protein